MDQAARREVKGIFAGVAGPSGGSTGETSDFTVHPTPSSETGVKPPANRGGVFQVKLKQCDHSTDDEFQTSREEETTFDAVLEGLEQHTGLVNNNYAQDEDEDGDNQMD